MSTLWRGDLRCQKNRRSQISFVAPKRVLKILSSSNFMCWGPTDLEPSLAWRWPPVRHCVCHLRVSLVPLKHYHLLNFGVNNSAQCSGPWPTVWEWQAHPKVQHPLPLCGSSSFCELAHGEGKLPKGIKKRWRLPRCQLCVLLRPLACPLGWRASHLLFFLFDSID